MTRRYVARTKKAIAINNSLRTALEKKLTLEEKQKKTDSPEIRVDLKVDLK